MPLSGHTNFSRHRLWEQSMCLDAVFDIVHPVVRKKFSGSPHDPPDPCSYQALTSLVEHVHYSASEPCPSIWWEHTLPKSSTSRPESTVTVVDALEVSCVACALLRDQRDVESLVRYSAICGAGRLKSNFSQANARSTKFLQKMALS